MKIQHICFTGSNNRFGDFVQEVNAFDKAKVFDDFDLNIIDLTDENLWRNKADNYRGVESINDLQTVGDLRRRSQKKSLVLLPRNYCLNYNYYSSRYHSEVALKDIIEDMKKAVLSVFSLEDLCLHFGRTTTSFGDTTADSDFYFDQVTEYSAITVNQNTITSIQRENLYVTTLQLNNGNQLKQFLLEIKLLKPEKQEAPKWVDEIKAFDDEEQRINIENSQIRIEHEQEIIEIAELRLAENNKWKSVLYTTGEELVNVVCEMLKEIFSINVESFVDEHNEDYRFEYLGKTVIIEIKGVANNVKASYVSQLDHHVHVYLDEHDEKRLEDTVSLLIINHQRNKPLEEREPVPEDHINLAERNGNLIIEIQDLFWMFEKYKMGELTDLDCWRSISTQKGILRIEQIG